MKHVNLIIVVCFALINSCVAQNKPDFRNFQWGDSIEKVQSGEAAQNVLKDTTICCNIKTSWEVSLVM